MFRGAGMITRWLDSTFYGGYSDSWDEELLRLRILTELNSDAEIIDIGAGRGSKGVLAFRGECRKVAGVDPDTAVLEHPQLDEAKVLLPPDFRIPYEDQSFDLAFSNSTIEHIGDPEIFFSEVSRVLRPGGAFFAKTPNKYHYVATIARLTPYSFRRYFSARFRVSSGPGVRFSQKRLTSIIMWRRLRD